MCGWLLQRTRQSVCQNRTPTSLSPKLHRELCSILRQRVLLNRGRNQTGAPLPALSTNRRPSAREKEKGARRAEIEGQSKLSSSVQASKQSGFVLFYYYFCVIFCNRYDRRSIYIAECRCWCLTHITTIKRNKEEGKSIFPVSQLHWNL